MRLLIFLANPEKFRFQSYTDDKAGHESFQLNDNGQHTLRDSSLDL